MCVSFFFSYLLLRETKEGRKRVISVTQRTAPFKSLFFYSFLSWIITEPFSGALRLSSSFPLSFCLDVSWEPLRLSQQKRMENLKLCASRVHRSRERERENVGSPAGAPAGDCDWLLRIFILFFGRRERELLGNISALACVHVYYLVCAVICYRVSR